MIWLVIRKKDNLVVNSIVWDGVSQYEISDSTFLISKDDAPDGAWVGWSYVDGQWVEPVIETLDEEQNND